MPISHFLLALLVVVIWGINYLFIALGLQEIPPLLLCAIRFILACIPIIFFIKPPSMPFKMVVSYGLLTFALQFALLFIGMHVGMTSGMASIIMQVQVFFSLFFAAIVLGETPYLWQIIGALVSFSGIGLVALHFDKNVSLLGFIFLLAASAAWGAGNLITKKYNKSNMISLVVWGCFVASFPMILLSLIIEGPKAIIVSYHHLTWVGILSILYITYVSTWVGYGVWNWLLSRYPVGVVVPFTLLVPIVGVLSSVIVLDEPFQFWKLNAGLLVMGGLGINLLGVSFFMRKTKAEAYES